MHSLLFELGVHVDVKCCSLYPYGTYTMSVLDSGCLARGDMMSVLENSHQVII